MGAKHTPGPWKLESHDDHQTLDFAVSDTGILTDYSVYPPKIRMPIASIQHAFNGKRTAANARLIAASPDLLEALKELLSWCDGRRFGIDAFSRTCNEHALGRTFDQANSAIAKATGKQP